MKKLTAGIFTVMLGLVAVDANAAITSKAWVEGKLATKQDTLTAGDHIEIDKATNTIKATGLASSTDLTALEGKVATAEGNITTLKGADTVTGSVANTVKTKIEALDVAATSGTGVIGSISQTDGKVAATYKTIKDADVSNDAEIAQSKIAGLTSALANKQNKLTAGANITIGADNTISAPGLASSADLTALEDKVATAEGNITTLKGADTVDGSVANTVKTKIEALDVAATTGTGVIGSISQTDGKVAATYKTITDADVAANAAIDQSKIDGLKNALDGKQGKLKAGANISIAADNTISATDLASADALDQLTGRVDTTEKDIVKLKEKDASLTTQIGDVPAGKNLYGLIDAEEKRATDAENALGTRIDSVEITANNAYPRAEFDTFKEANAAELADKQDDLNGEQMNAVNSGITADKVTALSELTIHGKIPPVCKDPAAQAGCALIYQGNSFTWEVIERDSNNN